MKSSISGEIDQLLQPAPQRRSVLQERTPPLPIRFNVATSCLQMGKLDDARTELETVLRLRPDFEPAKAALAEVEGQRANGAGP